MSSKKPTLASPLPPEDLRRGLYVAVLFEITEFLPCLFDRPRQTDLVKVRALPEDMPLPLEVTDVCLPFVTVRRPDGAIATLDIRRHELARLDDGYAQRVLKRLRPRRRRRKAGR